MKLCGVKVQAYSGNAYVLTFKVVCNYHFRALGNLWASLWQLNNGRCFVVFTPGNLIFRAFAVGFLTTHRNELARQLAFRPIALRILYGFPGIFDKKEMWILFHDCHITKDLNGYELSDV